MVDELTNEEKEFATTMMRSTLLQTDNVSDAIIATAVAMIIKDNILDGSDIV